jgi:formylglycine-generating enzyme required for sulfatase activity
MTMTLHVFRIVSALEGLAKAFAFVLFTVGLPGPAMADSVAYPATLVVGNPNNLADETGYGSVPYTYRIGTYEVTNEEYCEFLNAVESSSRYGLYRWQMKKKASGGIERGGDETNYTYSVKAGMARKPAVLMNWYETLRFCNWLSNGKGGGSVDTGPYTFTNDFGIVTIKMPDHAALAAGKKTRWVLASENEWYKSAYYDPGKPGGAGYWPYPVKGASVPKANLGSEAPSMVGRFRQSPSAYGTFDQGGNVWEWNETRQSGNCGVRGGSFWHGDKSAYMRATTRYVSNAPEFVYDNYGFRVVALGSEGSSLGTEGEK